MPEFVVLLALFGAGAAAGYGWRARISHRRGRRAREGREAPQALASAAVAAQVVA
jgi:hypothetical protein